MRILCVCDQGNSRSPTIASLLRYRNHDTLSVGAATSSEETRAMLADWCDLAILTNPEQAAAFPTLAADRTLIWALADIYPRPYNPELHPLVRRFIANSNL